MRPVRLSLEAQPSESSIVGLFVGHMAARTLGDREARALARAGEEIFQYAAERSGGTAVQIEVTHVPYAARLAIEFSAAAFDPGIFNLTGQINPDAEDLSDLALLIASRSVDRFDIAMRPGEPIRLTLEKDRGYPALPPHKPLPLRDGPFAVRQGDVDLLRHFGLMVDGAVDPAALPMFARHPDRIADFVMAGELEGALAVNRDGQIGGGILWQHNGQKMANFFGPYVLVEKERERVAADLVETCIAALSRTDAIGMFSRHVTADLPIEYFEQIGTLLPASDGDEPTIACFRQLLEDPGVAVWAETAAMPFLEDFYERLTLPREIRPVRPITSGVSVLSVAFDRERSAATIRPVLTGTDATSNVQAHLQLLRADRIVTILAEIDLGRALDATMIPAFFAAGFEPRFVLPGAGLQDVLVLQHPGTMQ